MRYFSLATATTAAILGFCSMPASAASFSALNSEVIKFNPGTSETTLIDLGVASVSFGDTTIYIGTNQVSANNQDPIVASFTNGIQDWVQSYDSSNIDGRGVGLLWDETSASLYGVFTADGGSNGSNTFGAATQGGWLSSYGGGGGSKASVLLKLNPETGSAEAGTYVRAELTGGNTNTVNPTGLDLINNQVVFFGDSFFTPLDIDQEPFDNKEPSANSPFPYRVVFTADLSQAVSAEAIGWDGVTAFSPLTEDVSDGGDDNGTPDPDEEVTDPGDGETDPGDSVGDEPDGSDQGHDGDVQSVPEPGIVIGLASAIAAAGMMRRNRRVSA